MPKFEKMIVSAGTYLVGEEGGGRRVEVLTPERLKHWATQFSRMKQNGLAVPGPWKHAKEAMPVMMGNNGTVERSDLNAGFWDEMVVRRNEQGVDTLWGIIEAPGDPNDLNTNAGKIGKVVKETSIYARPEFVDGKGNVYKDAIMHAALVTHPIEPGQSNFKLLEPQDGMTIAMSHCTGLLMSADSTPFSKSGKTSDDLPGSEPNDDQGNVEDAPTGDLKTVIDLLAQIGVIIPKDTQADNFNERLSVALQQRISGEDDEEEEEGSLTKPPKDAEQESVPMIMSTPAKAPEVTADVIMSHPSYVALKTQNTQLFNVMNEQARSARGTRINALIRAGKITKEYADANLVPMLSGFQMSFNAEGKEVTSPLDTVLAALEAQPTVAKPATPTGPNQIFANGSIAQLAPFLMSSVAPEGSETPVHPISGFMTNGVLSEDEADAVSKSFLENVGL